MNELILSICVAIQAFGMSDYRNKKACIYAPQIVKSAERYNIQPEVLFSLIFVESSFHRKAVSSKGACGLTQVIPKYTGPPALKRKYTCKQLKNPKTSIQVGAKVLSWWIKYHDGDILRALCGYNAGFRCGHVSKPNVKPNKYGMKYANKISEYAKILKNKISK